MTGNPRIGVDIEHDDRPHCVRPELERSAAQGRRGACQRREAERPISSSFQSRLISMRILAISGSLRRDSHNTQLLRAAATCCRPGPSSVVSIPRRCAPSPTTTRTCATQRRAAHRSRSLREAVARRRRHPGRDTRVQPLAPGRAEERDRLAVTPDCRQPVQGQDRRRRRREHRHVRRGLGSGRGAQGLRARSARASLDAELPVVFAHEQFDDAGGLDRRHGRCAVALSERSSPRSSSRVLAVGRAKPPSCSALAGRLLRVRARPARARSSAVERMRRCSALCAAG